MNQKTPLDNSFGNLLTENIPLPMAFYPQIQDNIDILEKVCTMYYQLPVRYKTPSVCQGIMGGTIRPSLNLILGDSAPCNCINNGIVPPNIQGENNAGLCFSNTCKSNDLKLFKLSDTDCSKYCDDVWKWINDKPPNPTSLKPEHIDSSRLAKICGTNFKPYSAENINKNVLIPMIFMSLLTISIVFLFLKKIRAKFIVVGPLLFITIIITLGLSVFLAKDLAGLSMCETDSSTGWPTGSSCYSKYTKHKIDQRFCSYKQACECYFNDGPQNTSKACGGNCSCINTTCIPNDKRTRINETIYTRKFKPLETIYLIFTSILLVILYLLLNNLYQYRTSLKFNVIGIIIFYIIVISIILYINLYKHREILNKKNCGPIPPP